VKGPRPSGSRVSVRLHSGLTFEYWKGYVVTSQTSHNMKSKSQKRPSPGRKPDNLGLGRAGRHSWQIQTAKARFSEVFRLARTEGPQRITRQGKEGVVMISDEQYEGLMVKAHQPKSIVQFFRESPLVGVELDLERDKDRGRDIAL
jgi:antitoxin Phd